ncbi:MAG: NgoMIV family type II restriction endonuclease [Vicinamibacteria bacterium]
MRSEKAAPLIRDARLRFHAGLLAGVLRTSGEIPSNADKDSATSVAIAKGILQRVGKATQGLRLGGQESGRKFEELCQEFVDSTFDHLRHLRPGLWKTSRGGAIARFEQYAHLSALRAAARRDKELAAALGSDYTISPDIVIERGLEDDKAINAKRPIVDGSVATRSSLRKQNGGQPLLHASISCKWTLRSDRAQNARSEGLNLVRNRKGRLPHVVVVTGEPLPTRLASIALGTGDIDCVYHFALYEAIEALQELNLKDQLEMLETMVDGKRLKDISDLPLDLAV